MHGLETALRLHQTNPVVVSHVDLPAELQLRRQYGQRGTLRDIYASRCRAAGIRVMVGAVFVHPSYLPEMALSMAMEQIAALLAEIAESEGRFCLVRSAGELDRALENGQIAILLSLEGSEPLGRTPPLLRAFHAMGVRLLGLTWNDRTMAADGCAVPGRGLTPLGREFAAAAWDLGMILDVSHLNDAGFSDLLALGGGPIIASHSNCRQLCAHPRNLTDAQIVQLAAYGGVIGINQVRFLAQRAGSPGDMSDLCAQLQHIERLCGPGHAGLGLDLARDYMEALPKPRGFWQTWDPNEEDILAGYSDLIRLSAMLLDGGTAPGEVIDIMGGSFLRVLRAALG